MAWIDAGCGHIDTSALTCKTGLVSRSMSRKVHIEDIVTKRTLKDLKILLLYVIHFNMTINVILIVVLNVIINYF